MIPRDLKDAVEHVYDDGSHRGSATVAMAIPCARECGEFLARVSAMIGRKLRVRRKRDAWWWRLWPDHAHTTLGFTLWLDEGREDAIEDPAALELLAHEADHWLQRTRVGRVRFFFDYVTPQWIADVFLLAGLGCGIALGCWWLLVALVPFIVVLGGPFCSSPRVKIEAEAMAVAFLVREGFRRKHGATINELVKMEEQWLRDGVTRLATLGYWLPRTLTARCDYRAELAYQLELLARDANKGGAAIAAEAEGLIWSGPGELHTSARPCVRSLSLDRRTPLT